MTFHSRIPTLHLLRLKDTQPKVGQTWQSCYASHRKSDQTSFLLSIANIISFMVILEEEFVSCKKPWHDMVTFLYYQGRHGSGIQIRASSNSTTFLRLLVCSLPFLLVMKFNHAEYLLICMSTPKKMKSSKEKSRKKVNQWKNSGFRYLTGKSLYANRVRRPQRHPHPL